MDEVMEALRGSAMLDERGLHLLKQYGYLPCDLDSTHETVAKGLEYALADACVAKVAKKLGRKADYRYFEKRSNLMIEFEPQAFEFLIDKIVVKDNILEFHIMEGLIFTEEI